MLDLRDAEIKHALRLERCHVGGGINLADATGRAIMLEQCRLGAVNLMGASITGRLSFSGSQLEVEDGPALVGDGMSVTGGMACDKGFSATGAIRLPGASIGGRLSFRGSRLVSRSGPALIGNGLMMTEDMVCDEGFRADGEIRLPGAQIGGRLSFSDAVLAGSDGRP